MPPVQPQQAPLQTPVSEPQVIIAQSSVAQPAVTLNATSNKKNFLLPIIIVVVLLISGGAIFLLKDQLFKFPVFNGSQNSQQLPADVNCTTGFEGNTGNNFCSNYHGGSSQCKPGFAGDYPDGCTK